VDMVLGRDKGIKEVAGSTPGHLPSGRGPAPNLTSTCYEDPRPAANVAEGLGVKGEKDRARGPTVSSALSCGVKEAISALTAVVRPNKVR
jgi:hypothetical protein